MGTILLSSGELRHYRPLGAVGMPVYTVASQLRAAIARQLGARHAEVLAAPQLNENGTRIDWYAGFSGPVVPWSAASEEERRAAQAQMDETLAVLRDRAAALIATSTGESQVFARQLALAASYPELDCIFLVDGRPVLTFWGFAPLQATPAPAVDHQPPQPPVRAAPVAATRRSRRWMALMLLPLLLLPLLFLKNCAGCGLPALGVGKPEQVMLVLDTSNSMRLPIDMERSKARSVLEGLAKGDIKALDVLESFTATNTKNRRIDVAKDALTKVVDQLPSHMKLGVVTFGMCSGAISLGDTDHSSRAQLVEAIRAIEPRAGTPLAGGLEVASFYLDGVERSAAMVVISDGEESCGGDPCATARRLKQAKPKLTINVIDVTGDAAAACVAAETGGRVLTPAKVEEFDKAVAAAAEAGCP
jgi:Ca-activated chloride channel family protein